jgi:hypothetical protein
MQMAPLVARLPSRTCPVLHTSWYVLIQKSLSPFCSQTHLPFSVGSDTGGAVSASCRRQRARHRLLHTAAPARSLAGTTTTAGPPASALGLSHTAALRITSATRRRSSHAQPHPAPSRCAGAITASPALGRPCSSRAAGTGTARSGGGAQRRTERLLVAGPGGAITGGCGGTGRERAVADTAA